MRPSPAGGGGLGAPPRPLPPFSSALTGGGGGGLAPARRRTGARSAASATAQLRMRGGQREAGVARLRRGPGRVRLPQAGRRRAGGCRGPPRDASVAAGARRESREGLAVEGSPVFAPSSAMLYIVTVARRGLARCPGSGCGVRGGFGVVLKVNSWLRGMKVVLSAAAEQGTVLRLRGAARSRPEKRSAFGCGGAVAPRSRGALATALPESCSGHSRELPLVYGNTETGENVAVLLRVPLLLFTANYFPYSSVSPCVLLLFLY